MNTQKGFTLIELMIVIAIIAILAAIALPAYNNYVAKSQVSEAVSLTASFKTPVGLFVTENGRCPTDSDKGFKSITGLDSYVDEVVFGGSGTACTITATMNSTAHAKISDGTLTIEAMNVTGNDGEAAVIGEEADFGITKWTCTATKIPQSLLPKSCTTSVGTF